MEKKKSWGYVLDDRELAPYKAPPKLKDKLKIDKNNEKAKKK